MAITEKYSSASGSGSADGSSPSNEWSWSSMITAINGLGAGGAAGLRVNHRGATTGGTSAQSFTVGGSSTSPFILRGYGSSPGDGYQGRTNGNGPLITTTIPTVTYTSNGRLTLAASWIQLETIGIAANNNNNALTFSSASCAAMRCPIDNASTGGSATAISSSVVAVVEDSDLSLSGASGGLTAVLASGGLRLLHNRITGGPAIGVSTSAAALALIDNLVYGCGGNGISVTSTGAQPLIYGNTIVDNTGDGINIVTGNTLLQHIVNNLITDNGGYGINAVSAANAVQAAYNRLDRNTSGAINLATDWIAGTSYSHDTTSVLKAAEYNNAASRDYRLLSTSPAKGIGGWSYRDIGAIQRQEAGGSSVTRNSIIGA